MNSHDLEKNLSKAEGKVHTATLLSGPEWRKRDVQQTINTPDMRCFWSNYENHGRNMRF